MRKEEVILSAPPRLMLGVAYLFWGAMLENPVLGLAGAILMEARHWASLRWKFGEIGFARSWQLSVVMLIVVSVVKMGSEDDQVESAMTVLSLLPLMFLPLMLAQQYCSDSGVPLTTFSFIARRKMAKDRAAGREVKTMPCQLGYPYLGMLMVSAGLGVEDVIAYSVGIVVLFAWVLMSMKPGSRRTGAWSLAFVVAVLLGGGMAGGSYWAYNKFTKAIQEANTGDARETRTALGQVEELKLSSAIDWRYQHIIGDRPARLRLSVYDTFIRDRWSKRIRGSAQERIPEERREGYGIARLFSTEGEERKDHAYLEEDLKFTGGFQGILRGQVRDEALLPIPANSRLFEQVAAEALHVNALGTTKVSDPEQGTLALEIAGGGKRVSEEDPSELDLVVLERDEPGVTKFWKRHGEKLPEWIDEEKATQRVDDLEDMPDMDQLKLSEEREFQLWAKLATILKNKKEYRYTTNLNPKRGVPPIDYFLNSMKEGHCEYYASATTLLLRRAGVPARYVIGYAIDEEGKKPGEWILRGKHAHAWCQAYLGGSWSLEPPANGIGDPVWRCRGGRWVDIDLTPSNWLQQDKADVGWKQRLADRWQLFVEDLVLWFGKPLVSAVIKILMWLLGIGLLLWIVYRLWTTKTRKGKAPKGSWEERCQQQQLLFDLEKWLRKRVKPRPVGMPLGEWLGQVYPEESTELVRKYQAMKFDPTATIDGLQQDVTDFKKRVKS